MMTMGISVGLAAFTGAVVVPLTVLEPGMWMHPLIMMMAVVVLGGLGSLKAVSSGHISWALQKHWWFFLLLWALF